MANTKRLAGTLPVFLMVTGAFAQTNSGGSKEWPTYGHDPGGMRFSPLTQLTPSNVAQLDVAWVYHMKPTESVAPRGERAGAGVGDAPEAAPPARGRGRGG